MTRRATTKRARVVAVVAGSLLALATLGPAAAVPLGTCGNGIVEPGEGCDDGNLANGDCCSAGCAPAPSGDPCDDGKACTVEDACRRGTCVGTPSDTLCGLTATAVACYRATPAAGAAAFERHPAEPVLDEFSADRPDTPPLYDVVKPAHVCTAAAEQVLPPPDAPSFEGYRIRPSAGSPAFASRTVRVETAWGTATLTLKRPRRLLVESGLAFGGGAAAVATGSRRYTCYDARSAERFPTRVVSLGDVRGGPSIVRVGRAKAFCVPERTLPERAHGGSLTCHKAKASEPAADSLVAIRNAFGTELQSIRRMIEICVPSAIVLPADPPSFAFQTEPDEPSHALATLLEQGGRVPRGRDNVSEAIAERARAIAVVEQNPEESRAAVLAALRNLEPGDVGRHAALGTLVEVVGDAPEILDHLRGLLLAAPATPRSTADVVPPDRQVRHIVLGLIHRLAGRGSAAARDALLAAVQSPDDEICAGAVGRTYALSRDRRAVQRAMRALLPADRHHLLYVE